MTEDIERQSSPNCPTTQGEGTNDQTEWTVEAWRSLDPNPDDTTDLDYTLTDWEEFETLDKTEQVIFLPEDESQIENAAFIVVDDETVLDLTDHC